MPSDAPSLALQPALTLLDRHDTAAMLDLARAVETKSCSCGCTYSPEQWQRLTTRRQWIFPDEVLELAECLCGSTMAKRVS